MSPAFAVLALVAGQSDPAPLLAVLADAPSPSPVAWVLPPPGWFLSASAAVVQPRIDYFNFFSGSRHVDLDATVEPQVAAGWRGPDGRAILADYRYLGASGDEWSRSGWTAGTTRFDLHRLDLTYVTASRQPWPWFAWRWEVGPRFAAMTQSERAYANGLRWSSDRSSLAAGVHGGYLADAAFGDTGLGLFHTADLGLLGGRSVYKEDGYRNALSDGVAEFRADAGLGYAPPALPRLRFATGLQYESIGWRGLHAAWGGFVRWGFAF